MNTIKTGILMSVLSVLLVFMGSALGGKSGAIIFFVISLGINFFSYYYSDKMVIKMTRSRLISEEQAPDLYSIVRNLTQRAGLPMPTLYITPSAQANAFATGRNPEHAAVAVTEGLMKILNREEVEGVLAHEIAHIKNRDILIGTIAASMAGAISMIANVIQWGAMFGGLGGQNDDEGGVGLFGMLAMAILAPIAALLVQMAISRSREYLADQSGALLAGHSSGLSNALLKLEQASQRVPMQVTAAASHLFIVNPLSGGALLSLFSTHPPINERVNRLRLMAV
ncbi:MAG: zinc metalloprotease HtpX [Syntrophomonas sp.]